MRNVLVNKALYRMTYKSRLCFFKKLQGYFMCGEDSDIGKLQFSALESPLCAHSELDWQSHLISGQSCLTRRLMSCGHVVFKRPLGEGVLAWFWLIRRRRQESKKAWACFLSSVRVFWCSGLNVKWPLGTHVLIFLFDVCVCVSTYRVHTWSLHVYGGVYVAEKARRNQMSFSITHGLIPLRQDLSLSPKWGWWPVSPSDLHGFAHNSAGTTNTQTHLVFCLGDGHPNAGPHTCSASSLAQWAISQLPCSCVWILGPCLVVLLGKIVEPQRVTLEVS